MTRFLSAALCVLAFAASAWADVKNGETYKCGSQGNVDFYVGESQFHDTFVSASNATGNSPLVDGTHGATERSTSEAPEMTVSNGGPTVRVHNGKAQYKNANGDWIDCGRPRKQTKRARSLWEQVQAGDSAPFTGKLYYQLGPGDDIGTMPLQMGDTVPYDGFMSPGEEVTSLPLTAGGTGPGNVGSLPVTATGGPEAVSPGEEGGSLPLVRP